MLCISFPVTPGHLGLLTPDDSSSAAPAQSAGQWLLSAVPVMLMYSQPIHNTLVWTSVSVILGSWVKLDRAKLCLEKCSVIDVMKQDFCHRNWCQLTSQVWRFCVNLYDVCAWKWYCLSTVMLFLVCWVYSSLEWKDARHLKCLFCSWGQQYICLYYARKWCLE